MDLSAKSVIFVLGLALFAGCSEQRDQTSRHLDELQQEISRLKASHLALGDRLEAVESRPGEAEVTDALVDDERPELETLRLEPGEAAPEEAREPISPPSEAAPPSASDEPRATITGDGRRVELDRNEAGGR